MKRAAIWMIPVLAMMTCGGCGLFEHNVSPAELQAKRQHWIERQITISKQRLEGEAGCPMLRRTVVLGVDITGENFWWATGDVIWSAPINFYNRTFGNDNPKHYREDMESDVNPDAQRAAILTLSAYTWGQKPPYTTRYQQIASSKDADFLVRAAAIRALDRARDKSAAALYIKSLEDPSPEIRLEAAKALANIPDANAIQSLTSHLHEDTTDVRIACADALRNYKTLPVAQTLVEALTSRDFGVADQAHMSLLIMTGKDFRFDASAWLTYLSHNQNPFVG